MTPAGGSTIPYTYDGSGTRLAEGNTTFTYAGSGMSSATTSSGTWDFTQNPGGGLASQQTPSKTTEYYLTDGSGSTVGLTDSSGNLVASASYDPMGNTLSSSGSATMWSNAGGTTKDSDSGMYSSGSSLYDPSTASSNQGSGNSLTWAEMATSNVAQSVGGGYTCGELGCVQTGGTEDCAVGGSCFSTSSSWGVPPTNSDPYNGIYTDAMFERDGDGCAEVFRVYHFWWGIGIRMNACATDDVAGLFSDVAYGTLGAAALSALIPGVDWTVALLLTIVSSYAYFISERLTHYEKQCNNIGAWLNQLDPGEEVPFAPLLWPAPAC